MTVIPALQFGKVYRNVNDIKPNDGEHQAVDVKLKGKKLQTVFITGEQNMDLRMHNSIVRSVKADVDQIRQSVSKTPHAAHLQLALATKERLLARVARNKRQFTQSLLQSAIPNQLARRVLKQVAQNLVKLPQAFRLFMMPPRVSPVNSQPGMKTTA